MTELGNSLERMSFMQLLLLFGIVTGYVVAVGGLFGTATRLRAAAAALLQVVAFAVLTDPWVHGALLVAFVVAGLGVFVAFSWLLARLLGPRTSQPQLQASVDTSTLPSVPPSQPLRQAEVPQAPKLARRARATR